LCHFWQLLLFGKRVSKHYGPNLSIVERQFICDSILSSTSVAHYIQFWWLVRKTYLGGWQFSLLGLTLIECYILPYFVVPVAYEECDFHSFPKWNIFAKFPFLFC
jgi:hypothetical protein